MCLTYTETQVPKKALSNFQRSLKLSTYLLTFLSTFFFTELLDSRAI